MITRDYHNFTLLNALIDAERVISDIRLKQKTLDVEFITGHGIIQTELMKLLVSVGLNPSYKLGNDGCIICIIE